MTPPVTLGPDDPDIDRRARRDNGRHRMTVIDWLLDSDPAIRWQVMRDLTARAGGSSSPPSGRRIATEGWGARLLALQAPDGRWAGQAWSHDWTDTFHVLELLRRFGLDPGERAGAARDRPRPRAGHLARCPSSRRRGRTTAFFEGEVEPCINGNVVATGSYFGVDMAPLVDRLLGEQLSGRRLELRGRERRDGVVVRDDDQRPRGPARARASDRRLADASRRRAGAARRTCSSAGCSGGSRPAR